MDPVDLFVNEGDTSRECQVGLAEQERRRKFNFYHHLVEDVDDHFLTCIPVENHTYIPMVRVRKL